MISYDILKELGACDIALKNFKKDFTSIKKYTIDELMKIFLDRDERPLWSHIAWLLINHDYCRKIEVIQFYISSNPYRQHVLGLIKRCEYCQKGEANTLLQNYLD